MRFVDTNILIYAVSPAPHEARKRRIAQDLLTQDDLALSVQVMQEFYHQVTRPTRPHALTPVQALRFVEIVDHLFIQELTFDLFLAAVSISRHFRLSYWDGAILAAAGVCGCDVVYSEDLGDGQDYNGIRVINPFSEPRGS